MRPILAATVLAFLFTSFCSSESDAQGLRRRTAARPNSGPVVSQNFVVTAPDPLLANKVSAEAERYRKTLALAWLGHELPDWEQKCPITVELGMHAGGETSFAFVMNGQSKSTPIDWRMKIFGPADRVLDAVLPHEITHTIFATHFGQPLPRWADEGACTTVEHESERKKNHQMLMNFLTSSPSRGLPFNRMFTMRNYPHDILPLYAQGHSLAKFLILQKGKHHFVSYIGKGLQNETATAALPAWDQATNEFYKYQDLSDLQIAWLDWVRKGSDETAFNSPTSPATFARADVPTTQPLSTFTSRPTDRNPSKSIARQTQPQGTFAMNEGLENRNAIRSFAERNSNSWYAQQMKQPNDERVAAKRHGLPTQTRKVAGDDASQPKTVIRDSSLPSEFRPSPATIWR
ncbi:MAG: hypothetical protein ACI814_003280 [Mariniblastus sp.]|jgi:hypothetical protein